MDKIASPRELSSELRTLVAYSESATPSREKLARSLRLLADRVESNTKTANTGYEILSLLLTSGNNKLDDLTERLTGEDEQCLDLLGDVCSKLQQKLSLDSGSMEALGRVRAAVEGVRSWRIDLVRNNIFKAANSLGIKLPSGMF